MKKIVTASIVAFCVAMGSSCFASAPAAPKAEDKAKAAVEQTKEAEFKGIVKKHEDGAALITKDKTYPLTGGDFAMIVGKEVNITGKLVKEGEVEKLVVSKMEVAKKK